MLLTACDPSKLDDTAAADGGTVTVSEQLGGLSEALDATPGADGEAIAYVTGGESSALCVIQAGESVDLARFEAATNVVATPDGAAWLVAEGGAQDGVYVIADGVVTTIATGVKLGSPAGIALPPDDAALMISSLAEVGWADSLTFPGLPTRHLAIITSS